MTSGSSKAKTAKNSAPKNKRTAIRTLIHISRPWKFNIFMACACVLLINLAVLIKPVILQKVIDDFLVGHLPETRFYSLTTMGLAYLLVSVATGGLSVLQVNLVNTAGQHIVGRLRNDIFRTIQYLPLPYLDKTSSGRLITRATNDVAEIGDMYTDALINLVKDVFLIIGITWAMLQLNWKMALVSLAVIPPMALMVIGIKNKIRNNFFTVKHIIGRINSFMAESISGMKVIQLFRAEKEKGDEFHRLNQDYFRSTMLQVHMNSLLRPAADIFQCLSVALVLWYSMSRIAGHSIQIGVLYAFTTYIKQFFNPIADLSEKYNSIQSALVSTERITELLDQEPFLEDTSLGETVNTLRGDIEFRNVWFSYNQRDWVLRDVSFHIAPGQSAAFVGQTGAGKTTIISLINGFYSIQKGQILIDGKDIRTLSLHSLRQQVAVVLQDVFLFSGTIRSNITLGDDIPEDKLRRALAASRADTVVAGLPGGLDEPVMERGATLSAGQRQLISFARALAHDPGVFVLDEATAHIDTETEKMIQQALADIMKDRTTLVIAHRLSTIMHADQIIVMKDGAVSETGNHQSLLAQGGYYASLISHS